MKEKTNKLIDNTAKEIVAVCNDSFLDSTARDKVKAILIKLVATLEDTETASE